MVAGGAAVDSAPGGVSSVASSVLAGGAAEDAGGAGGVDPGAEGASWVEAGAGGDDAGGGGSLGCANEACGARTTNAARRKRLIPIETLIVTGPSDLE
jgi:hypothetical protein